MIELKTPFEAKEIEWRVQASGFKKSGDPWVRVVAYVNSRAVQDRLDQVVGPGNWKTEFVEIKDGFLCTLSIYIDGRWVSKSDGAQYTHIEPLKGGISDAFKRAAVQWGIGRYLYKLDASFAEITPDGQHKDKVKSKDGKTLYVSWNPPVLPYWALPSKHDQMLSNVIERIENLGIKEQEYVEYLKKLNISSIDDLTVEQGRKFYKYLLTLRVENPKDLPETKDFTKSLSHIQFYSQLFPEVCEKMISEKYHEKKTPKELDEAFRKLFIRTISDDMKSGIIPIELVQSTVIDVIGQEKDLTDLKIEELSKIYEKIYIETEELPETQ